ncbi:probable metal-nicotianamine transporter YSL7 [Typha latifolia]|uniref:probable metal-nicotianamine transporter YSL7 n=1 Tax=Typha latifolia TaxID=4733 RepID=UPI003C2B428E
MKKKKSTTTSAGGAASETLISSSSAAISLLGPDLKALIHDHSLFFDRLVELIPARFYLPTADDDKPWYQGLSKAAKASAKIQSRENLKKARRARLDPSTPTSTLDLLKKSVSNDAKSNPSSEESEEEDDEEEEDDMEVEQVFEGKPVPTWREQLTVRAFVVSLVLGFFLSFVVMKLNLTTGIIPSMNVSAGLLGFFFVKTWTTALEKLGILKQPFTRQENTVIQTCVVACSGIAFSGGFGSYILGMTSVVADQQKEGATIPANVKNLSLGWMIGFMFVVSFVGLFSVVPLRKIMIIGYKLTYPSGTATAHLINSFHTPHGAKLAKKQVGVLFKSFGASFFWSFFQWFYTAGDDCGFLNFPSLGLKAYTNSFYFDFSATYVGVGMICPYMVNISLLLGAIISWGILWPCIETKKGIWYPADLSPSSLRGEKGYKVFVPIAMILGDGLCNFIIVVFRSSYDIYKKRKHHDAIIPVVGDRPSSPDTLGVTFDERRRTKLFLRDPIPFWLVAAGYVVLAVISIITVPRIFPQLRFYHIIITYLIAPALAFCNSYGCGLTDWSLASSYGKLAIFIFGAWVGTGNGGIIAGLAACGVMMSIVSTASDLMQDFKTGYLTLASPRSMFVSQVVGTAMGCVIAPSVFWIFYKAFPLGADGSAYPAPYASLYRGIAFIGSEGFSSLPSHCLNFCLGFFLASFMLNALRTFAKYKNWRVYKFIPYAMGMAVPFFVGAYFTIDMCLGSLILFLWERTNRPHADAFAPAVASGLICGDGIWSLPASLLALGKVKPPICMKFLSRVDYAKVNAALSGGS